MGGVKMNFQNSLGFQESNIGLRWGF
jgi:hypothetical protein